MPTATVVDIATLKPESLLRRRETALALTRAGFPTKASTLSTLAARSDFGGRRPQRRSEVYADHPRNLGVAEVGARLWSIGDPATFPAESAQELRALKLPPLEISKRLVAHYTTAHQRNFQRARSS
jgi:hypothetical protein